MITSIKNHSVTYWQLRSTKTELHNTEKSISTHLDTCIICKDALDFDGLCPELKLLLAQYTYLDGIYKLAKTEYMSNIGTCNL